MTTYLSGNFDHEQVELRTDRPTIMLKLFS